MKKQKEQLTAEPTSKKEVPSRGKWMKIGLLTVLAIILLGGAYSLGNNNAKKTPASPSVTTAPMLNADPIDDWETYRSPNFSVKYPADWYVNKYDDNNTSVVEISDVKDSIAAIKSMSDTHTRIQVQYFSEPMPSCFPYTNGGTECINSTIKTISHNEYSGIRGQETSAAGLAEVTYLKNPNSDGYASLILFPPQTNGLKSKEIYQKMLSTLKFTDSTASNEAVNWKTYANDKYGISFRYPPDWKTYDVEQTHVFGLLRTIGTSHPNPNVGGFGISVWKTGLDYVVDDFINVQIGGNSYLIDKKPINMFGAKGFEVTYRTHIGNTEVSYFLDKNNLTYQVSGGSIDAVDEVWHTVAKVFQTFELK